MKRKAAMSVPLAKLKAMARHTTFRYCLNPTVEQQDVLARHADASRFAFNQCLRMVKRALTQRRSGGVRR
ncbi:helix-turn-helix domain-containing protein [Mycobacterium sp.]|uniref:helix-turn-helix domain-containing protein n=1 Tax=Mycobacterium sp. TaxID=1785 RepID=UPI0039C9897B